MRERENRSRTAIAGGEDRRRRHREGHSGAGFDPGSGGIDAYVTGLDEAIAAAKALDLNQIVYLTDITHRDLAAFYDLFATTEKVGLVYSHGVNQSSSGTDKVNAIINCHLATGRIGKPGVGPFSVTGQRRSLSHSAAIHCCRWTVVFTRSNLRSRTLPVHHCIAVYSVMASAGCPMSRASGRRRRRSRLRRGR